MYQYNYNVFKKVDLVNCLAVLEKRVLVTSGYSSNNVRGVVRIFPNGPSSFTLNDKEVPTLLSFDTYREEFKFKLSKIKEGEMFRFNGDLSKNFAFNSRGASFEGETEVEVTFQEILPLNKADTRFDAIGKNALLIEKSYV